MHRFQVPILLWDDLYGSQLWSRILSLWVQFENLLFEIDAPETATSYLFDYPPSFNLHCISDIEGAVRERSWVFDDAGGWKEGTYLLVVDEVIASIWQGAVHLEVTVMLHMVRNRDHDFVRSTLRKPSTSQEIIRYRTISSFQ